MLNKLFKCLLICSFASSQLCFIVFVIFLCDKNADIAIVSFAGFIAFGLASVGACTFFVMTKKVGVNNAEKDYVQKFCPYCGEELKPEPKQESKQSMSQEEFDKIFLGMLKDAGRVVWLTPNGKESELPTCRFDLRNSDNKWMFDVDLNSETTHFWFSIFRVQAHFLDKYGLQYEDTQQLMKNMVKQLFKLNDVTPTGAMS